MPKELLAKLKLSLPINLHDKSLLKVGIDLASGHTDWVSYFIQWNCGIVVDLDKKDVIRYKRNLFHQLHLNWKYISAYKYCFNFIYNSI